MRENSSFRSHGQLLFAAYSWYTRARHDNTNNNNMIIRKDNAKNSPREQEARPGRRVCRYSPSTTTTTTTIVFHVTIIIIL